MYLYVFKYVGYVRLSKCVHLFVYACMSIFVLLCVRVYVSLCVHEVLYVLGYVCMFAFYVIVNV